MNERKPSIIQPSRVWHQEIQAGCRYFLRLVVDEGSPVRTETLSAAAVAEWMGPEKEVPLHRGYLLPDGDGWSGQFTVPENATGVSVALYFWTQIAEAPASTKWRLVVDEIGPGQASERVKLAVAHQATTRPPTIEGNTDLTLHAIREAGRSGVKLLCLSENFLSRNVSPQPQLMAIDHPAINAIRAAVAEAQLYATFAFPERTPEGRSYVTAPLIGPEGQIVGMYRKQFLTQMELENGFSPGHGAPVFATPLGRIAVNICYDFWYPETSLAVAKNGADIICHPLAGDGLQPHWDHSWRGRAIDHQCYVLSSVTHDCGGKTPSRIIAPDGSVIAETWQPNALAIGEATLPWTQEMFWFSVGPSMSSIRNVMDGTRAMFAPATGHND